MALRLRQKNLILNKALISSARMLEDARQKIFVYKNELETKNLVNEFINQVVVYENEIQYH